MNKIHRHFIEHPSAVGMSYWQHFGFAMNLCRCTFLASLASLVHAFLPFMFTTTTSRTIFRLNNMLKSRLNQDNPEMPDKTFTLNEAETYKRKVAGR